MVTHAKSTKMHCKGDRDEGKTAMLVNGGPEEPSSRRARGSSTSSSAAAVGVRRATSSRSAAPACLTLVDGGLAKPMAAPPRARQRRRGFHPDTHLLARGSASLAHGRQWRPGGAPSRCTPGNSSSSVASLLPNDGSPQLPTQGSHRRRRTPAVCSPQPPPPRAPLRRPCDVLSREWLCGWWLSPLDGERTSSRFCGQEVSGDMDKVGGCGAPPSLDRGTSISNNRCTAIFPCGALPYHFPIMKQVNILI
jgi:hypothetical protein